MNGILPDLDDFLAPSQECIKMIVPEPKKDGGDSAQPVKKVQLSNAFDFEDEEEMKVEMNFNPTKKQKKPDLIKTNANSETGEKTAKISLQDCLACSGCVTSAETVLLQQHSVDEFMKLFTDENEVFIAVSPQSVSSLTNYFGT